MPNLISREAAMAAIEKLEADVRAQLMLQDDSYRQTLIRRRIRGIQQAKGIIAALPAAGEQSGIVSRRIAELREIVGARVPGEHSIAEIELDALVDLLESNPAAPSDQD